MRLLTCSIILLFTTLVNAQAISNERKEDIKNLLQVTGAFTIGEQMGNAISQQIINAMNNQPVKAPAGAAELVIDVVREHINSFITSDEAVTGMVNIYAKFYTEDEVKGLLEFYNTALGKKVISINQQLAQESAQFGQQLFLQRVPQIQKDIQDRLQAAGMLSPAQPQPQPQPQQ